MIDPIEIPDEPELVDDDELDPDAEDGDGEPPAVYDDEVPE